MTAIGGGQIDGVVPKIVVDVVEQFGLRILGGFGGSRRQGQARNGSGQRNRRLVPTTANGQGPAVEIAGLELNPSGKLDGKESRLFGCDDERIGKERLGSIGLGIDDAQSKLGWTAPIEAIRAIKPKFGPSIQRLAKDEFSFRNWRGGCS